MVLLTLICVFIVFVLSWCFLRDRRQHNQDDDDDNDGAKPIPGPKAIPVIGNIHQLDKHHLQRTLYKWMQEYGPVFKFSMLSQEVVIISDAVIMKEVFGVLRDRPESFPNDLNHNGGGIVLSNYDGNQTLVKDIAVRIFHETFQDPHIKKLQDSILDDFIDHLTNQTDGVVDVYEAVLKSIATQFASEITGNKPTTEMVDASLAYFACVNDMFANGRALVLTLYPWLRYVPGKLKRIADTTSKTQAAVVKVMCAESVKTYRKGNEHGILHRFMTRKDEENLNSGDDFIVDDNMFGACIIDVIAAGFGGTAANIAICILYMLLYPDVKRNIYDEISELRKVKTIDEITETDVPYLMAFIMECIRLGSMVHATVPHNVHVDVSIAGYRFTKDQIVMGSVWNVHHNDVIWSDPFDLRPERFLEDSGRHLVSPSHPLRQTFVPFGVGARACKGGDTGMDKVFRYLLRIVDSCSIEQLPNYSMPSGDPRNFTSCVALDVPKFSCVFSKRK